MNKMKFKSLWLINIYIISIVFFSLGCTGYETDENSITWREYCITKGTELCESKDYKYHDFYVEGTSCFSCDEEIFAICNDNNEKKKFNLLCNIYIEDGKTYHIPKNEIFNVYFFDRYINIQ